jgi:hypothetical protein
MGGAISRCIGSYGWCFAAVVKWFEAGKLHLARTDFCWRDAVSVYVPHGNGKTTLAAPIALYIAPSPVELFDGRENEPAGRLEARAIGADFLGFLRPSRAVMPRTPTSPAN